MEDRPAPGPMIQSAHKLSLILIGLRCGCCIILAQEGDLQPVGRPTNRVSSRSEVRVRREGTGTTGS